LLLRGVSILEGTGRQLDADLNVPESIEPFAKKIAAEKFSSEYILGQLKEKAKFAKDVLTEVPLDLLTILEKVKDDKITVNHKMQDFDNLQLILHRMGNKFLLSILADRKSTRLNSSHVKISYAVFCLKKKKIEHKKDEHHK